MAETDILNPTSTDELNPDYGFQRKRPITHQVAKASGGPAYTRDVTDMMHQYVLSWGSTPGCAKMLADIKRLKNFSEQFRDGYFTIIDWDDDGRNHVGRFVTPVEPIDVGNNHWAAQNVLFEEVPDVPMVTYPGDWTNDAIWRYVLNDFGELQPAVDNPASWVLAVDPDGAISPGGQDLQSSVTDAYAQLAYVGWGCQIWMPTGPDRGIAGITLDGVSEGTIDCYTAAPYESQSLLQLQSVPLGKHILQVQVTGTKNPSSSGYLCVFDALRVMR